MARQATKDAAASYYVCYDFVRILVQSMQNSAQGRHGELEGQFQTSLESKPAV